MVVVGFEKFKWIFDRRIDGSIEGYESGFVGVVGIVFCCFWMSLQEILWVCKAVDCALYSSFSGSNCILSWHHKTKNVLFKIHLYIHPSISSAIVAYQFTTCHLYACWSLNYYCYEWIIWTYHYMLPRHVVLSACVSLFSQALRFTYQCRAIRRCCSFNYICSTVCFSIWQRREIR